MLTAVSRIGLVPAMFLLLVILVSTVQARTWTSADGRFTIEAELVEADETIAKLKKADGQIIQVPIAKLSPADQTFIKNQQPAPAPVGGGDGGAAKELLEAKGLKVLSSGLQLPQEGELTDGLKEAIKARTELLKAYKQYAAIEQQETLNRNKITQLTQLNVQLNAQLAQVRPNDISTNNRLVSAINANASQIELLETTGRKIEEVLRTARAAYNQSRESYVQQVLDLRSLANDVNGQYSKLATDSELRAAVASLSASTGRKYELAASRSFKSAERRLKSLEDTVLSEQIALRREGKDSFYVSVVINGDKTKEMLVDSGASVIALPNKMATDLGIEVGSQDREIVLVLADGSRITAHEVTIPEVRVGKFTVKDVRAAVLGPEATEAEPLLGMSFLRHFKFEVNAQTSTLTMVKVEEGQGGFGRQ